VFSRVSGDHTTCPECHARGHRAIYYGFPVWTCFSHEDGLLVWGFWSVPLEVLPWDGWVCLYDGPYLSALWKWLGGAR